MSKSAFVFALSLLAADAGAAPAADPLLAHISPDSLRGHLSFLASDLLEGRGTPSRGQDLAAEYIASQYRRAGLEPVGDDGYFQTAHWQYAQHDMARFQLVARAAGKEVSVPAKLVDLGFADGVSLDNVPVVWMAWRDALADASQAEGKILAVPTPRAWEPERLEVGKLKGHPAAVLFVDPRTEHLHAAHSLLIDPEDQAGLAPGQHGVTVHSAQALALLQSGGATVSLHVPAAAMQEVKLRNVVGLLRGSDPRLAKTYVMVTAHYDHLGIRDGQVYNGANDDGSGTVSVIELAQAFAAQKERPRRSLVFVTLFGEELGDLGSHYYGRHPIFPVKDTVADLNLEQVGRTDDSEGPQRNSASITGYGYTTMTDALARAGAATGIKVWKHPVNSDLYFARSDNQALADLGVPAHTLCTAFDFGDYHGPGDDWQKVDYDNMARVDRMVAVALRDIANDPVAPAWTGDPKAAPYAATARALKAQP